ncbi:MAG: hypothetical protein AB7S26_16560 [Sandaracinaceae bacterium]
MGDDAPAALDHPLRARVAIALVVSVGATLGFAIQPLAGKSLLPSLGGAPATWTACLLFFQTTLLIGYVVAHLLGERARPAWSAGVHGVAILVALGLSVALVDVPLAIDPSLHPLRYAFVHLTVRFGPVAVALAMTVPLASRWVERRYGARPYGLYAVSNAGSLLALAGYPLLIEPWLDVPMQERALVIALGAMALVVLALAGGPLRGEVRPEGRIAPSPVTWRERAGWALTAALPTVLLAGTTARLSLDVAPLPLLWVIPLAVYLASFILAFQAELGRPPPWLPRAVALVAVVLVYVELAHANDPVALLGTLHVAFLFGASWLAHRRLFERAPDGRSSELYLAIAIGGALGTLLSAVLAPLVLSDTLEYAIAIAFITAWRPLEPPVRRDGPIGRDLVFASVIAILVAVGALTAWSVDLVRPEHASLAVVGPAALVSYFAMPRRRRYALALLAVVLAASVIHPEGTRIHAARSFFGALRVLRAEGSHVLLHGSTLHGEQRIDEMGACTPRAYYAREGPAGAIVAAFRARPHARPGGRVALIGLGTGALACYARPDEEWRFYEIDPEVAAVAQDSRLFTYLAHSPALRASVRLADGRDGVAREPEGSLRLLIVDGFGSDAVPVHLLTLEALRLYLSRVEHGGWVVLHVSNRALDLVNVVADGAAALDLPGRVVADDTAVYVVLARRETELEGVPGEPLGDGDAEDAWTDAFSSVLTAIRKGS